MPTERLLAGWSEVTPDHFRFTLKAPRRITHDARLRRAEESTAAFCGVAQTLGSKLGVLLFQLPPSFKKDLGVLDDFLAVLHRLCASPLSSGTRPGTMPRCSSGCGPVVWRCASPTASG